MNVQQESSLYPLMSIYSNSVQRNIKDGDAHKTEKRYHFDTTMSSSVKPSLSNSSFYIWGDGEGP